MEDEFEGTAVSKEQVIADKKVDEMADSIKEVVKNNADLGHANKRLNFANKSLNHTNKALNDHNDTLYVENDKLKTFTKRPLKHPNKGLLGLILDAIEYAPMIEKVAFHERVGLSATIDPKILEDTKKDLTLLQELKGLNRAQDVFAKYTAIAAKQLVMEMINGKTSNDRRKAATELLDRELGKAINRQVSVNMTPSDFGDEELDSNIRDLNDLLGFTHDKNRHKLIKESERDVIPSAAGSESGEDETPVTRAEAEPRRADEVS